MKYIVIFLLAFFQVVTTSACSIFSAVDSNGHTWAGNNEDFAFSIPNYINVVPKTTTTFGYIAVAYSPRGVCQGGVNDAGLFLDMSFIKAFPGQSNRNSSKPTHPKGTINILAELLKDCETVPEAIAYISKYNTEGRFSIIQIHFADKYGNLGISTTDTSWVTDKKYSVSTNFHLINESENSCERYPIAKSILMTEEPSLETFTKIADAVHQAGISSTKYSNIHNLSTGEIWFYHGMDYSTYYKTSVSDLLALGDTTFLLKSLLPNGPLVRIQEMYDTGDYIGVLNYFEQIENKEARQEYLEVFKWVVLDVEIAKGLMWGLPIFQFTQMVFLLWMLFFIVSVVLMLYTIIRIWRNKASKGLELRLQLYPVIAGLSVFAAINIFASQPGSVTLTVVLFLVFICCFILASISSLIFLAVNIRTQMNRFIYWSSIMLSAFYSLIIFFYLTPVGFEILLGLTN